MSVYFSILSVMNIILCTGLGAFMLFRNPRHPANIGYALGMASFALIEAGSSIIIFSGFKNGLAADGVQISLFGQTLMPVVWLLFSCVFARANYKEVLSRQLYVFLLFALATGVFSVLIFTPGFKSALSESIAEWSTFSSGPQAISLGPIGRYLHTYLVIALVFNLVHLENTLRSSSGSKRWQIKYVIFGIGSILAYFIYLSSQALLFSSLRFETIPLTSTIILVCTSMMAFFIVRHRLLDVDIFVSRYFVYNSFTVLIVGFYLLAVGLITHGIRYFRMPFDYLFTSFFIFISILSLVIFLFTASIRRKAELFINRNFYKHKYEFRDKWMETTERISSKRSVDEIVGTLTEMVSGTMGAKGVYIWLYDPASRRYSGCLGALKTGLDEISHTHPFSEYLRGKTNPFRKDEAPDEIKEIFNGVNSVLCAPFVAGSEVTGFMMLGPDMSGQPYIQDDFEFLKALLTQAALQIKNIRLSQELMASKEVETFSRMSSFIMHDLKNLTNSLSLISQNAKFNINNPDFQQDAIRTIDGTVSRMKRLIDRLSNVPKELELKKEITDMGSLIRKVMGRIAVPDGKEIEIRGALEALPPIYIDPEAIEMVIFNIILNAYEAIPGKGSIDIKASRSAGYVDIVVSDSGLGISKEYISTCLFQPFKTTKKNGFGIGLFQCKTVIEAHGGSISVESEPGAGTSFTVRLPAETGAAKKYPA